MTWSNETPGQRAGARQGLEPRTRGLRVRCSGFLFIQSTSIFTLYAGKISATAEAEYRLQTGATAQYRDIRANMELTRISLWSRPPWRDRRHSQASGLVDGGSRRTGSARAVDT